MRRCTLLFCLFAAAALLAPSASAQQEATLTGTVSDAEEGFGLAGANVVLLDADGALVGGTATDEDGRYRLTGISPGSYVVEFRFVGYAVVREEVTLEAGETRTLTAALTPRGMDLNTVVVTASRQAEKVLDAPASISVLDMEEIESDVVSSSAAILRNTTGVDMAQTGIDRYEIVLRGFNNAFSGATYVLTDYRQSAIASLGVNAYNMMPITQIDLERVEVVRGPGSALYGAGVDAGVVHFITKDPFTHPGTTVSVGGGSRETFLFSGRHAGVVNDRIGYKIVGNYSRAEDWHFDPENRLDSLQLASFRESALPVDYDNYKYNINGSLSYRFRPNVSLTANGGFATSKSIFLSGVGTLQSDGFGYSFGQLRLDADNFFAQAYVNANEAGDSFVYREDAPPEVVDNSILFNAQAQYDFSLIQDRLRLITGADYELTLPDTKGTINGRNENDDEIQEVGLYAQAAARLHSKLDATLALRADHNNVVDQVQLSPRAALVFKPNASHSVRASFNRAFSSPGTNSLFLDLDVGSAGILSIRARGAADGFTFPELSPGVYEASSLLRYNLGQTTYPGGDVYASDEMRLGPLYAAMYSSLAEDLTDPSQLPPPFNQLTPEQLSYLVQQLGPMLTPVTGSVDTRLGYVNLTTLEVDRFPTRVADIEPLEQTVSHTYEVGYKGLFGERLLLAVDGFYVEKENFVGPLGIETPFMLVGGIRQDFEASVAAGISQNAQLMAALTDMQENGMLPAGVPVQAAAANFLLNLAAAQSAPLADLFAGRSSVSDTYTPIGIVQPNENAVPYELLLSYRNFGRVTYYGFDVSSQFMVSDRFSIFGNLSWINDNFFDADELGEDASHLELSMNAPKTKVKGGFSYSSPAGWRTNASVRYVGEFRVVSGPYRGVVDAYTLIDLGAGYDFDAFAPGLSLDASILNVLNEEHREFIGAPRLGRLGILRVTYDL